MLFYGIPLVLALVVIRFRWSVSGVPNILAALALMTGLLFNLLILLFDTAVRVRDLTGDLADHRRELVRQLQANVTYTVLIALISTSIIGGLSLAGSEKAHLPWSAIVIAFVSHFVLLLAMILRRVRAAFLTELPPTLGGNS